LGTEKEKQKLPGELTNLAEEKTRVVVYEEG
jgi:hypothetical protein